MTADAPPDVARAALFDGEVFRNRDFDPAMTSRDPPDIRVRQNLQQRPRVGFRGVYDPASGRVPAPPEQRRPSPVQQRVPAGGDAK